jgi:hypothetical protein
VQDCSCAEILDCFALLAMTSTNEVSSCPTVGRNKICGQEGSLATYSRYVVSDIAITSRASSFARLVSTSPTFMSSTR